MEPLLWKKLFFSFVLIALAFWPFHNIPEGSKGIIIQFGEIKRIDNPGISIQLPWQSLIIINTDNIKIIKD